MKAKQRLEHFLFAIRWNLIPFYLIVWAGLLYYLYDSLTWFITYLLAHHTGESSGMLFFITTLDIAMIASLGKMIVTGSYNSFVSKEHHMKGENVSSGLLKVKMATSLIGISSIHLLRRFVEVEGVDWEALLKLLAIHSAFIIGGLVTAWIYFICGKTELIEQQIEENEKKHEHPKDTNDGSLIRKHNDGLHAVKQTEAHE